MNRVNISPITDIVAELKAGRMVVVVDDEDRENEGDLLIAAEFATPEAINFMAKHGRGLICLTLTKTQCEQLQLPLMVTKNDSPYQTNFTVSIEAAEGVTTGISAQDRALTVAAAIKAQAKPSDIVQPGHIFPLKAMDGGVLARAGHTEAGCDLPRMAGLNPASVICEILKDDGTMARLPDLLEFAATHQLKIGTIADLIEYRAKHESLLNTARDEICQTPWGALRVVTYLDAPSGQVHIAIVKAENNVINPAIETLVRVHEPLSQLDWLGVDFGNRAWLLPKVMEKIATAPQAVVVLLNCAQSAEQLLNPMPAASGGRSLDLRTYGFGAQILKNLGVQKMQLLSRPRKMPSMSGFGLEVTGFVPFEAGK